MGGLMKFLYAVVCNALAETLHEISGVVQDTALEILDYLWDELAVMALTYLSRAAGAA
jgi:hypothetical protein